MQGIIDVMLEMKKEMKTIDIDAELLADIEEKASKASKDGSISKAELRTVMKDVLGNKKSTPNTPNTPNTARESDSSALKGLRTLSKNIDRDGGSIWSHTK
jgi:hypothetical protein